MRQPFFLWRLAAYFLRKIVKLTLAKIVNIMLNSSIFTKRYLGKGA